MQPMCEAPSLDGYEESACHHQRKTMCTQQLQPPINQDQMHSEKAAPWELIIDHHGYHCHCAQWHHRIQYAYRAAAAVATVP